MRGRWILALVMAAPLLFAARADAQGAYGDSRVAHFKPGVTTRADAVAALGSPNIVYDQADGSRIVTWVRKGGLFDSFDVRRLSILFDRDNVMVRVVSGGPSQS